MGVFKVMSICKTEPFSKAKMENLISSREQDISPNPHNYSIVKYFSANNHLVVMINYPNCTNYEGNKILVFENTSIDELKMQKLIDPHFFNSKKYKSPFARFRPTDKGWKAAISLIKNV
jgi:hypothetical protein